MNKAFYILFFFFFLQNPCKSQNLIYNGDFEIYDTCPVTLSQPGNYQIEHCTGWYSPSLATSDYYNICANWPVSVPSNAMGNIYPFSGNGYCGILLEECKNLNLCSAYWGYWVEYIQSELTSTLISGQEYEFKCNVAVSNKSDYAFSRFGAYFTELPLLKNDARPFNVYPQVLNQLNNYLDDTLWMKISGTFIASGNEKYITLGLFPDTTNLDTLGIAINWTIDPTHFQSYYFIDNSSLIEVNSEISIPNIFSPNDDEVNEIFKIENAFGKTEMKIYNRWGELVYFAEGRNCYWDGRTYAGVECPEGVYYYSIKIEEKEFKGFVHLIR